MSEIDLNDLMATFLDEAADDIDALENGLLALERTPSDAGLRHELLRRAHTIKGNASCVGLTGVTEFAHAYEEVLERIDGDSLDANAELVTLLLSGVDALRALVANRGPLRDADRELLQRLASVSGAKGNAHNAAADLAAPQGTGRTLRVATEKLNRMLDLAGEIAIARGRVHQLLASAVDVESSDLETIIEIERQVDQLQGQLQELIMRARMVPVGVLFRSYERTVRDVAAAHGKNARLITIGDDVEVDSRAVETLREPLTHMIRNAIDHGIETSADRLAAGKPALGRITLEAKHEAGTIVITVSDDGAGLDRSRIAERASAMGLDASDSVIFEHGFSTAPKVTDLSGRGVGMDVVRRAIESLRGTIAIATNPGQGTAFTVRLPLTLAVIDGFRVTAAGETYVVPMEHVIECVELPDSERGKTSSGVLLLRDEVVPYVRLRSLFGVEAAQPARENVLVVHYDRAKAGLVVDELHGGGQAVIKPLGNYFDDVPGIAGSSILGDGRVALILDTAAILRGVTTENV
ncbi:MAG TPA: chemotaxis protein CheA [Thermoanaerobaculia bacterium]|nr:chemotaxis protein CheA [Thermoanaerobaculia bacterium]